LKRKDKVVMFRTLKSPINVQVEITECCNHICRHCYNYFRHEDSPRKTMSLRDLDRLVEEFEKNQIIRVVVTGGEPLVVPDLSLHLIRRCKESGMGITLNSNLTLFSERLGLQLRAVGITSIMTSLLSSNARVHDGITQIPGSWQLATNNIKLAIKMGFRVLVNMVLTKWNISTLRDTGDLVGSWGAAKFGATRACAPGPIAIGFSQNLISIRELRDSLTALYELKKKWGYDVDVFEHYPWCALGDVEKYRYLARRKCTAGVTSASIGANGEIRPCGHSALKYGNVLEEGLEKTWARMVDCRDRQYVERCKACPHVKFCTGGCQVEEANSSNGQDYHCIGPQGVKTVLINRLDPVIGENHLFSFVHPIILRQEVFGGILVKAEAGQTLLDKSAFDALSALIKKDDAVSVSTLIKMGATKNEAKKLIVRLSKEGLIKEKKGGGAHDDPDSS